MSGLEVADTLLVPTSPRKPDPGGHGASEACTAKRRGPSISEFSKQADLGSDEGVRRSNEQARIGEKDGAG